MAFCQSDTWWSEQVGLRQGCQEAHNNHDLLLVMGQLKVMVGVWIYLHTMAAG